MDGACRYESESRRIEAALAGSFARSNGARGRGSAPRDLVHQRRGGAGCAPAQQRGATGCRPGVAQAGGAAGSPTHAASSATGCASRVERRGEAKIVIPGRDAPDRAGELAKRTAAPVLALLVLGLSVTGCHKKTQQAYRQPPPPVMGGTSSSRAAAGSSSSSGVRSEGNTAGQPAPEVTRGKPSMVEVGLASWYGPPYA